MSRVDEQTKETVFDEVPMDAEEEEKLNQADITAAAADKELEELHKTIKDKGSFKQLFPWIDPKCYIIPGILGSAAAGVVWPSFAIFLAKAFAILTVPMDKKI